GAAMRYFRLRYFAIVCSLAVVAWVVAWAAASTPAHAQSVADFYKGRSLSMIVGFSAGSGYDVYARLLARFMGRYIPGNPTIIAQNMPGAGSLRAAQYVANVAPKDGSVIG